MDAREWEEQQLNKEFGVIPEQCPACGQGTVRLIWRSGLWYGTTIKSSVDAGKALLVGEQKPAVAPVWACLACSPGWLNVHQLTLEVEDFQVKKEGAVAEADFKTAKRYVFLQDEIRSRQRELVSGLV